MLILTCCMCMQEQPAVVKDLYGIDVFSWVCYSCLLERLAV